MKRFFSFLSLASLLAIPAAGFAFSVPVPISNETLAQGHHYLRLTLVGAKVIPGSHVSVTLPSNRDVNPGQQQTVAVDFDLNGAKDKEQVTLVYHVQYCTNGATHVCITQPDSLLKPLEFQYSVFTGFAVSKQPYERTVVFGAYHANSTLATSQSAPAFWMASV